MADPEILKWGGWGRGGRQCISHVVIYRKCTDFRSNVRPIYFRYPDLSNENSNDKRQPVRTIC